MRILLTSKWVLLFLLFSTCILITYGRRGGGGSRGGGSRGGSSRGSSRGSSNPSRGTTIDRSRDRGRTESRNPSPPAPPPPKPAEPKPRPAYPSPRPQPKPSAPEEASVRRQPAVNPNYKEQSPAVNQQPPPYSPRERPPPYSPSAPGQQGPAPPPYSPSAGQPGFRQPQQPGGAAPPAYPGGGAPPAYPGGVAPPAYPGGGIPSANYPRQPGFPNNPQQGGIQTGSNPQQGGIPGANYPRQPGFPNNPQQGGIQTGSIPQQGGIPGANYPRQPGLPSGNYPQHGGVVGANYPRQPGVQSANYPRQPTYPPQTLGSNVWQPQSGMKSPAYMNYGGLPTGANMHSQPLKQKGFLGSLSSMGSNKPYKNKYYGSRPSPYKAAALGGLAGVAIGGAAMYTILPYMAMRSASSFYRPYGYGYHSQYYGHGYGYGHTHYDVYNNDYVGRCNRPITPEHAKVICNSTRNQVDCDITCEEGYRFPDNTTSKMNKCWHVSGTWKPTKNFPDCSPVCAETCMNGGSCVSPGVCGCSSEYRGPHCEFHFLNCDIRKLASGMKIRWVCTHTKNETSCRVKCESPAEFATPSEPLYKCTPDGVWTPNIMPLCVYPDAEENKLAFLDTTAKNATEEVKKETPESR